ncbi:MAG TPA: PEP-CTERM sorting domain-containing protein [Bryobacteraceae bacterium]|nr:PEP-CTERM sorting domain-containing protein [Bryobacteraceae bacterium]
MRTILNIATLILFSITANATVIYLDSDAASTTNNSTHATVDLLGTLHPNPHWGTALADSVWISYGSTGDHDDPGYFSPANGTQVIFSTTFFLSGAITAASLTVMADDSSSVILNGHTLKTANSTAGQTCSNVPIGCLTSTEGVFTFGSLSPYLVDGTNTLSFGVLQVNGSSFGLDFAGSVTDNTATPEPATLACIGAGLLALAAVRRRK